MFQNMDYIYEVYKEKSFSKAAKKLFLSQSSLSLTIKSAEKRIGADIFDRSKNPIRLTDFGKRYILAVEEIKGIENSLENYIYDMNNMKAGNIAIGAGNFFATWLVPPAISIFRGRFPNIGVRLVEGRTIDLTEELNKNNIDMLVTNGILDSSVYSKKLLFKERMVLVVPKKFLKTGMCTDSVISNEALKNMEIFNQIPEISLDSFYDIPFIGFRTGNDSNLRYEKMFSIFEKRPNLIFELDQSSTAFSMAVNGMGACIVGDTIPKKLGIPDSILLFKLSGPYTERDVAVYTKTRDYFSRAMKEFTDILALSCIDHA